MACVSVQPEGSLRHDQPGVDESPLNDPENLPFGPGGERGLAGVRRKSFKRVRRQALGPFSIGDRAPVTTDL